MATHISLLQNYLQIPVLFLVCLPHLCYVEEVEYYDLYS